MATLSQLATTCGGKVDEKDKNHQVHKVTNLLSAAEDCLAPYHDKRYAKLLTSTNAGAIITDVRPSGFSGRVIEVANPQRALAKLMPMLYPVQRRNAKIERTAQIADNVQVPEQAYIGHHVVIESGVVLDGNVEIHAGAYVGANTVIASGVSIGANCAIMHSCDIGENVKISAGAIIGADGFGYVPAIGNSESAQTWQKMQHVGKVTIGNNVEIGANTTIDRGSIGDTVIEDDVIIDNLVQIAHNVKIGQGTAIAGCAAIAGSTTVGSNCLIAGGAALIGHLDVCDGVTIHANSLVTKSIKKAGVYSSSIPAQPSKIWRKAIARLKRLS